MKTAISTVVFLAAGFLVHAQEANVDSVDELIKKLGSAKFTTREQAFKTLMNRPEAEAGLRKAARFSDAETQRRIAVILEHFERRPLRELAAYIKSGRMDEIIQRVADWPEGKYEDELWAMMTKLVDKLYELHLKKGGQAFASDPVNGEMGRTPLPVIKANRVTQATKAEMDRLYFIRAHELFLSSSSPINNELDHLSVPVVAKTAIFKTKVPGIIFAGEKVVVHNPTNRIIICGGDVFFWNQPLSVR